MRTAENRGIIGLRPAVGYLRRSTDRQEQSIGDQKRAIELYALSGGYEVLDFYVDDAISGASSEGRASFQQLISDAKRKDCPFQYVLVYDVKRFGRVDNDEAGFYRYQLRRNGIEVIYVSEGFSGDDTDDLLRPVKQWQARQELKDLSKVAIRGMLTRSEGAWWMGGTPPYGYDLAYYSGAGDFISIVRFMPDGSKQMLDQDGNLIRSIPRGDSMTFTKKDRSKLVLSSPERVGIVKDIFDRYLLEGLGYKGIADKLNHKGVPSARGGQWGSTTAMAILSNPAYVGDMVWNRLTGGKFHRISGKQAKPIKGIPIGGMQKNGREDWIVHEDAHPAIISRSRFEQAQAKIRATKRYGNAGSYRCGRGANSPYLLAGLIHCSNCGHNWTGYRTIKGRKRKDGSNVETFYYACNGYISKGKKACPRSVLRKDEIETWVMDTIGEMIKTYFAGDNSAKLRKLIEQELETLIPDFGDELDKIDARLGEIEKSIANLIDNITSTNRDFVDKRIIELRREIAELESRKRELEAQGQKRIEIDEIIDEAMAMAGDYRRVFAEGSVEEKRYFLRAFLSKIELDPTTGEGKARFVLLPGLKPQNMPEFVENSNKKAPKGAEMSSELLVAGGGFEPPTFGL
jgi:DNA invertase Pin-like site-specific DNA recombinase